jgi:hypothetical protein
MIEREEAHRKLVELCRAMVPMLPGSHWRLILEREPDHPDYPGALWNEKAQAGIHPMVQWDDYTRARFAPCWPKDAAGNPIGPYNFKSISVSTCRSTPAIAADVARRLWAPMQAYLPESLKAVAANNERIALTKETENALSAAFPGKSWRNRHNTLTFPCAFGNVCQSYEPGKVKISLEMPAKIGIPMLLALEKQFSP